MNDNNLNNNLNFIDSIPAKDIHSIGDIGILILNICNIKIIQHEKNYIRNLPIDIISFILDYSGISLFNVKTQNNKPYISTNNANHLYLDHLVKPLHYFVPIAINIRVNSKDQGWSSNRRDYHGSRNGSSTWGEICIHKTETRIEVDRNKKIDTNLDNIAIDNFDGETRPASISTSMMEGNNMLESNSNTDINGHSDSGSNTDAGSGIGWGWLGLGKKQVSTEPEAQSSSSSSSSNTGTGTGTSSYSTTTYSSKRCEVNRNIHAGKMYEKQEQLICDSNVLMTSNIVLNDEYDVTTTNPYGFRVDINNYNNSDSGIGSGSGTGSRSKSGSYKFIQELQSNYWNLIGNVGNQYQHQYQHQHEGMENNTNTNTNTNTTTNTTTNTMKKHSHVVHDIINTNTPNNEYDVCSVQYWCRSSFPGWRNHINLCEIMLIYRLYDLHELIKKYS